MIDERELIFVVDEENIPLDPLPRKQVHEQGIWHRTAHIWIINSQKQILCQKRSLLKDSSPGKWEAFFGGHMAPNSKYIDTALLELKEELGIDEDKDDLILYKVFKGDKSHEFQGVFYYKWEGDISILKLEVDEVDQVKWFGLDYLEDILVKKPDPNWSIMGYEKELFKHLRS